MLDTVTIAHHHTRQIGASVSLPAAPVGATPPTSDVQRGLTYAHIAALTEKAIGVVRELKRDLEAL